MVGWNFSCLLYVPIFHYLTKVVEESLVHYLFWIDWTILIQAWKIEFPMITNIANYMGIATVAMSFFYPTIDFFKLNKIWNLTISSISITLLNTEFVNKNLAKQNPTFYSHYLHY